VLINKNNSFNVPYTLIALYEKKLLLWEVAMKKESNIKISSIEYKNNEEARSKLIKLIIDCIIENGLAQGDENGNKNKY
jgi:hypothetical protein